MTSTACCSKYCNVFSIIDSEELKRNDVRLLPISTAGEKRIDSLLVKNNDRSRRTADDLNHRFWSRWLYDCRNYISGLTIDELGDLERFIEKKSFATDVIVHSEDGTIVDIPEEFSKLFDRSSGVDFVVPAGHFGFLCFVCFLIICSYISATRERRNLDCRLREKKVLLRSKKRASGISLDKKNYN